MAQKAKPKAKTQDKVLRIGIVQGGKVVQERLIPPGEPVQVGDSAKNTFVFPGGKDLPSRFTLFAPKGKAYELCFKAGLDGKVAHKGAITPLADLAKSGAAAKKGAQFVLPLTDRSRGKVVIGTTTVLFQFVPAPPESARMVSRQDFRPKLLEEDDPLFLAFLALNSTMAAVLMIYVFNTEPVEKTSLEEIPDRFVEMIIPKKEDKPVVEEKPEESDVGEKIETEEVEKEEEGRGQEGKDSGRESSRRGRPTAEAEGRGHAAV